MADDRASEPPSGVSPKVPIFRSEETRSRLMAMYDEHLRSWPVPFETSFVPTRYGSTHVVASGKSDAPPLVLLHGMGVGAFVWASIAAALSTEYRVYALDTIGDLGRSELDDPKRYPKNGRDYSMWLDDVYQALDVRTADIVAGSMGGWIAMHYAICERGRVRRLALLGPMGLPSRWATARALAPIISYVLRPTDARRERVITWCLGDGERVSRELRPWMRLMVSCRPSVGTPFCIPGRKLRMITAPTLVILGAKDRVVGDADAVAKRAQRNISNCETEILPDAGHAMSVDEPEKVASRIVSFFRGRVRA